MTKLSQEDKVAVNIAKQLAKASPSNKISWKKFRELMSAEGYEVETDKNYTERIRYYVRKYKYENEMLESVANEIGELYQAKRETQKANAELNKLKRAAADDLSVIDALFQAVRYIRMPKPVKAHTKQKRASQYTAVITPSDWHTGLIVEDMKHDTQIKRVKEYAKAAVKYLKLFNVTSVKVVDLGDIIENTYLHIPTSTATSQFNTSKQFAAYIELFLEFLQILSLDFTVEFKGIIAGNHDRLSKKDETLTGDSFSYIATKTVAQIIKAWNNPNITYDLSDYNIDYVNFKEFTHELVFIHGDKEKGSGEAVIRKYMSILDKPVNYIVKGHTHSFKVETESHGRKIFTSGTLNDANDYARGLGYYSTGSQMLLLCNEHTVTAVDIELGGFK